MKITDLLDAVELVLRESGPQPPESIVSMLDEMRLWKVKGPDPISRLEKIILADIERSGANSRFIRCDDGVYAVG